LLALCGCELPVNGTGPIDNSPSTRPATVTDAEAPKVEAAALPPNGDQAQLGICHSAAVRGDVNPPGCKSVSTNADVINNDLVAYAKDCQVVAVPIECSTCDYTCDCILRYTELPDAGCTCSQNATGGVIVISGC
jgi:hypothetical protein